MLRPIQFEPRRALSALRAVTADPDALSEVFGLVESLSLDTLARLHARLETRPLGRRLLQERPQIVPRLADRAALAALPEGSLGREYLAFVEREGISAEGLLAAQRDGQLRTHELPPELRVVQQRARDTHDLWHAVTGYHGDLIGEAALLAFSFAQTRNPAVLLMSLTSLLAALKLRNATAAQLILDGYRRGRNAAWLVEQPWEELLAEPVAEVRARLRVGAVPEYVPLRSSELRELGLLPKARSATVH
jgi:ubiquinone biosynthesis protein COQ4